MAKAQTMKPKSSIADWFRRLGAPKPKAAARPGAASQSSTMTNIAAVSATATRPGAKSARPSPAPAAARPAPEKESGWSLADFRLEARGEGGLALTAWGVSALCLLVVAGSMLRARALRRSLREKRKRG